MLESSKLDERKPKFTLPRLTVSTSSAGRTQDENAGILADRDEPICGTIGTFIENSAIHRSSLLSKSLTD